MRRVAYKEFKQNVLNLPRLPIPSLEDTFSRYATSIKPLKKEHKVAKHLEKMKAFQSGCASRIQRQLVETDAAREGYPFSYIEALWDEGYLGYRVPLVLNVNPAFGFKKLGTVESSSNKKEGGEGGERCLVTEVSQAKAAAHMAHSITKYMLDVIENGVSVSEKNPTDVSQIPEQFCTARIPQPKMDVKKSSDWITHGKNITVLHDGFPYLVNVVEEATGKLVHLDVLIGAFEYILNTTPSTDNTAPVSALTALPRDTWAQMRAELLNSEPSNAASFDAVDRSIIVICLDNEAWETPAQKHAGMLYGGAKGCESRWFDKHQIIVSADGQVAANYEHSFSDGLSWARWCDAVYSDVQHTLLSSPSSTAQGSHADPAQYKPIPLPKDKITGSNIDPKSLVQPINFTLGRSFSCNIREGRTWAKKVKKSIQMESAVLPFGKALLKELRYSPDAFVQLCLHLAYYRMHSTMAPTYESCSTAKYFHGRTETIRTATPAVRAFFNAWDRQRPGSNQAPATDAEYYACMQEVMKQHVAQAKRCADGQGVDRHLLALKNIVEREAAAAGVGIISGVTNADGSAVNSSSNNNGGGDSSSSKNGAAAAGAAASGSAGNGASSKGEAAPSPAAAPGPGSVNATAGSSRTDLEAALTFFRDPPYTSWNTWLMSTSNVSLPFMDSFNFGPVDDNGYGIGYVVEDYNITLCITNMVERTTSSEEFKRYFIESSVQLIDILKKGSKQQ